MTTAPARTGDEQAALRRRVQEIKWFHTIDLGGGVVTPGLDDSPTKLADLALPDLAGKSVLDIGSWDGFFAFEAERRGASRVLATDSFSWSGANWGSKDGFELAREALGSGVEDAYVDVMDLFPDRLGTFDVVFFLGVLYHMRHPLLALERAAAMTDERLILETHVDMPFTRRPAAAFYPRDELNHDDTNWWGPNAGAVEGMLHAVGFREVVVIGRPTAAQRAARLARGAANVAASRVLPGRKPMPWLNAFSDRLVVHALK
jgi:tRNA (mo5U34)-methyltransferase